MKLREIANAIGICEDYAPEMDILYESLAENGTPACDLDTIDRLQKDYNTFGEFYTLVREVAQQINNDPLRSAWIKTASAYTNDHTRKEINRIPVPKPDGSQVTSLLPLYILIHMLPASVEEYRRRGFNEKEIGLVMNRIWDGIRIVKRQTGMPGINETYYRWQTLFATTKIFEFEEGLQFELKKAYLPVVYIRNKATGEVVTLMTGMIHRSGEQLLGSAGYEETDGAFEATFREDNENIYGYGYHHRKIETTEHIYPKSQWEVLIRPGDNFISMHIPEGKDIAPETVIPQLLRAKKVIRERFPEHNGCEIFGSSWLLNPGLQEIIKPESKIARFMSLFTVHPILDDGESVFSFVFDRKPERLKDLPEDSSLRRGLKKMYLEGRYNHIYAGIVTEI